MEYGIDYLRRKLERCKTRVDLRYQYYEMKNHARDFGISTPPDLRMWFSALGWCAKAVDALADRIVFREMRNDYLGVNEIFSANNPTTLFDSAVLSAMISSCCFVYISRDSDGTPRLQIIDGGNATGVIDPITGMLTEGYAVLERNNLGAPIVEAYFTPDATTIITKEQTLTQANPAPFPLLVPIVYRPDARRPFGHSRISRACMSITGSALRSVKRSEISAEFYSYPQKYATGLSEGVELDKWAATMSSLITFTKDEDGDHPIVGQFQQQTMSPHVEQLKMFASMFAGETGLTLDDLGFSTANPSSDDAIKSQHENLRLTARKAQRTFGSGFLNVGYLAACVRDNMAYDRKGIYAITPVWEPIFELGTNEFSAFGDAIIKVNQAVPGYFDRNVVRDVTGIEGAGNAFADR